MPFDPRILLNKFVIGGAVIAIAVAYHLWVVNSLESDLAECRIDYAKLSAASDIQNAEVDRLFSLGKQYGNLVDEAKKANESESKRWASVYEKLGSSKIPVDCDGAMTHLRETLNETAQEWFK